MHHATLICKLEARLWSQRFTDPVIKLISPIPLAGAAEVVNGFSLYLHILMSLYQFCIHHSRKMEGTAGTATPCGRPPRSAVTAVHRVVHHRSHLRTHGGPGSPYSIILLPSLLRRLQLPSVCCHMSLCTGMIKLLQWQQQVMSHTRQNAAVSKERNAGEPVNLIFSVNYTCKHTCICCEAQDFHSCFRFWETWNTRCVDWKTGEHTFVDCAWWGIADDIIWQTNQLSPSELSLLSLFSQKSLARTTVSVRATVQGSTNKDAIG